MQDNTITFWEPPQKTFYILSLIDLRSMIAWGYDLTYEQVRQVGYSLPNGEHWISIQTEPGDPGDGDDEENDYHAILLEGHGPDWDILLDDLAHKGKIPPGDYLLSVY